MAASHLDTDLLPPAASAAAVDPVAVDYDLHGLVGIRLLGARPGDIAAVDRQLGPIRQTLQRPPDITIRFVERLPIAGKLRLLGLDDAGFTDDAFLVLRSKHKSRVRVQIPMARVGAACEIVCEHGITAVPLLIAIVNLTALGNGALPLHAAAFNAGGTGVLCTGWSKGGKTEMLLAFMARGARYIGDEWVYIDARGERMHGIPEPIRVWDWHMRQLPELRRVLGAPERARLNAVRRMLALEEHLGRSRARRLAPVRLLGRLRPLLQHQGGADIHPRALFGDRLDLSGPLEKIVLVGSHMAPEITVRRIDPSEIASRMVFSLQYERLPFMALYHTFRFAFPATRNALVDGAEELQRERLQRLVAGKDAFALEHPYPVAIPALYDALAPLL